MHTIKPAEKGHLPCLEWLASGGAVPSQADGAVRNVSTAEETDRSRLGSNSLGVTAYR